MAVVFCKRQAGLPLELLMQTLDDVGGARTLRLARRQAAESKEAVAGVLQAVCHHTMLEAPLADKSVATASWQRDVHPSPVRPR